MNFLPMPKSFDQNEWFILISIPIFLLVALSLPKRFPRFVTILIYLLNCVLAKTTDYFISGSFPYDLYDYNDSYKLDFFDEWLQLILYPIVGYLMNYWYDVWKEKGFNLFLFVLFSSGLSCLYEWTSVQAHVFNYKGWNLYYSYIAYVILISINIFFLHFFKKWASEENLSR